MRAEAALDALRVDAGLSEQVLHPSTPCFRVCRPGGRLFQLHIRKCRLYRGILYQSHFETYTSTEQLQRVAAASSSYAGSLSDSLNPIPSASDMIETKHNSSTASLEGQDRIENSDEVFSSPEPKSQDPLVCNFWTLPPYEFEG